MDFADFLLGVPSSYTQGQAEQLSITATFTWRRFAQDSWKANEQLTVNYGVRWDRIRPWLEKFNQLQTLVKGEQSQVFPGAPRGAGISGRSGRAGFAGAGAEQSFAAGRNRHGRRSGGSPWLQKILGQAGQTSVRLGYGMYYTAYEGLSAGIMSANPPYGYTYTSAAPPLFDSPFTVAATGANAGQRFPVAACGVWSEPRESECERGLEPV